MTEFINPDVQATFRPATIRRSPDQTVRGFVSRSAGGFISCPPYVIASVAERRVAPSAELNLPEGYEREALGRIMNITGFVDKNVEIDDRQADELAQLGRQILALNEQNQVQPPLSYYEKQSIGHLVMLVDQAAAGQVD